MKARVVKTGSLGPWSRVIVYCKSVGTCYQLFLIPKGMTGSILTLLQYTMTLLQGPKDPVLPTLTYIQTAC